MPRPGRSGVPKIIDHDQRRIEIVLATQKLIVAGGFDAATMREIAAAAGYANGALKRYFDGKDQILMATSKYVADQLITRLEKAVDGYQGLDAVAEIFEQTMPNRQENIDIARVLITFWERAIGDAELSYSFREDLLPWRRLVEKYLEQAQRSGEMIGSATPATVADELLTFMAGAHLMIQLRPTQENIQNQVEHVRRRISALRVNLPTAVRCN